MIHTRAMDPASFRHLNSMFMTAKQPSSDQLLHQASTAASALPHGNNASFASFENLTNPAAATNALRSLPGSSASIQDYLRNQLFFPSNAVFPQFQHQSAGASMDAVRDVGPDNDNMALSVQSWLQNNSSSAVLPLMDNYDLSRGVHSHLCQHPVSQMANSNSNLASRSNGSHLLNASINSNQLAQLLYQAAQQEQQLSSQQHGYSLQHQLQATMGSSPLNDHHHHPPPQQEKIETDSDAYAEHGMIAPWSSRAAGLLGGMLVTSSNGLADEPAGGGSSGNNNNNNKKPKLSGSKRLKHKNKDKPKRPLSAYNLFFRDERGRILAQIPDPKDAASSPEADGGTARAKQFPEPPPVPPVPARPVQRGVKSRGPPHGKIGFEGLARLISERWHNLPPSEVARYKEQSDLDRKRYKNEMTEYREKKSSGKNTHANHDAMNQSNHNDNKYDVSSNYTTRGSDGEADEDG